MIKQDAIVKIEIGTDFLQKLQHVLLYITNGVTLEQIETYKKIIQEQGEFTEDWMEPLSTISILLREIETKAVDQGFTYDIDIDELPAKEEN
jgi:hypothetical protein